MDSKAMNVAMEDRGKFMERLEGERRVETKHSATPWTVTEKTYPLSTYTHAHGYELGNEETALWIAVVQHERRINGQANAEFICRAVNSHDALIEALRAISLLGGNLSDEVIENVGGVNDGRARALMYSQARQIARAAIAKATGDSSPSAKENK